MPSATRKQPVITVRVFQAEDHSQIVRIFSDGIIECSTLEGQTKSFWVQYLEKSLTEDIADLNATYVETGGNFWVATTIADGKEVIVGIVGLQGHEDGECELRRLSVAPAYRRFSVGRMLVAALEQWAIQSGFTKVRLATGTIMTTALAFYELLGYKRVKTEIVSTDPVYEVVFLEKLTHTAIVA